MNRDFYAISFFLIDNKDLNIATNKLVLLLKYKFMNLNIELITGDVKKLDRIDFLMIGHKNFALASPAKSEFNFLNLRLKACSDFFS